MLLEQFIGIFIFNLPGGVVLFHIRWSFSAIVNEIGQEKGHVPGKGGEVRRF